MNITAITRQITLLLTIVVSIAMAQGVINNADGSGCTDCAVTFHYFAGNTRLSNNGANTAADCKVYCTGVTNAVFMVLNGGGCYCFGVNPTADEIVYSSGGAAGYVGETPTITIFTTGGDPHIKKWTGEKFDFHGECDLILVHAPDFAQGLGLYVHLRTTIEKWFSYIEAVAFKTGDVVANIDKDGFWLDNHLITNFPLVENHLTVKRFIQTDRYTGQDVPLYQVSIKGLEKVLAIRVPVSKYMFVDIKSHRGLFGAMDQHFVSSEGLMGDYKTGKALARDGETEIDDMVQFGMEWQVQPQRDEMLFLYAREPQLPESVCNMPTDDAVVARRTLRNDPVETKKAEKACGHVNPDYFNECVDDVLATGDAGIAAGY